MLKREQVEKMLPDLGKAFESIADLNDIPMSRILSILQIQLFLDLRELLQKIVANTEPTEGR
jgi:hypothetical protein